MIKHGQAPVASTDTLLDCRMVLVTSAGRHALPISKEEGHGDAALLNAMSVGTDRGTTTTHPPSRCKMQGAFHEPSLVVVATFRFDGTLGFYSQVLQSRRSLESSCFQGDHVVLVQIPGLQ